MTKLILQAGQSLDVVHYGSAQFFCVVDGQTTLASTIYHENDILTNVTIQRLIVDSTMIVSIETDTALTDENGNYRMINGKKSYQIEEKTPQDKDMNLIINRVKASGMTAYQYLKSRSGN